jgi:hypothetical protein
LAALRYWQASGLDAGPGFDDIATDGGTLEAMDADEIDGLCERINTGGVRVM